MGGTGKERKKTMPSSQIAAVEDRNENARAIRNCLAYLAREAKDSGFRELAQLIDVAALAAADATREMYH